MWSESNISYKQNIDYQTFAPRPLGLGITSMNRSRRLTEVIPILASSCNMTFLFRSPLVAKTYDHGKLDVCHKQAKRLMRDRTLSEDFSVTDLASFDSV